MPKNEIPLSLNVPVLFSFFEGMVRLGMGPALDLFLFLGFLEFPWTALTRMGRVAEQTWRTPKKANQGKGCRHLPCRHLPWGFVGFACL